MTHSAGEPGHGDTTQHSAGPPLKIYLAYRPVPALRGRTHPVAPILASLGHEVIQVDDCSIDLPCDSVLWIMDNANWFPKLIACLRRLPKPQRPLTVVWHWEPLPHPAAAGSPSPRLSLREWIKVIIGDARATDLYTNYRRIAQLGGEGIPDILAVCSFAWHEYLQERGIESVWVPIGRDEEDGDDLQLDRDLTALFLGSLDIPRRKRILKNLRKQNVDVCAQGSWFEASSWGDSRTELINRALTFLNIQRYPGEFAGHRLVLGMANKSLVISEPIYKPLPFEAGKALCSGGGQ